jgi:filamentous hemagglutinin family protein
MAAGNNGRRIERAVVAAVCAIAWPQFCLAQVVTDGAVGGAGNKGHIQTISPSGGVIHIAPALGSSNSTTLLHSFQSFSVPAGQTAEFSGSGYSRVLARVTGGGASQIDGAIRSTIDGADFYLINPAGIMFGPGASIDVSGDFVASTAQYIAFQDGTRFAATTDTPVLTTAPITAFGFVGTQAKAGISVNGGTLATPNTRALRLAAAGPIQVNSATLSAPGGEISMYAATGTGEIPVQQSSVGQRLSAGLAGARIDVIGSAITAKGDDVDGGFGRFVCRAGDISITNSNIRLSSAALPDASGPSVDVVLTGGMKMTESRIVTEYFSDGSYGEMSFLVDGDIVMHGTAGIALVGVGETLNPPLRVSARSILVDPGGEVQDDEIFGGAGFFYTLVGGTNAKLEASRFISIEAQDSIELKQFASIFSNSDTGAIPSPIFLTAPRVILNGGQIKSAVNSDLSANVTIAARDRFAMVNGASIKTVSDEGNAGNVSIAAKNALVSGKDTTISVASGGTIGGTLLINAASIRIEDGARLNSQFNKEGQGASGERRGGDVKLRARSGTVIIDRATINSDTLSVGDGGRIFIEAPGGSIRVQNHSALSSSAEPNLEDEFGVIGNAGVVSLSARQIDVRDSVLSSTTSVQGNAGSLSLAVSSSDMGIQPELRIVGSQLTTSTTGIGNAGNITLSGAGGSIVLEGSAKVSSSSDTGAAGNAGKISLAATGIHVRDSELSSATVTSASAGSLSVIASPADGSGPATLDIDRSTLQTSTTGTGNAGNVTLQAPAMNLHHTTIASSSTPSEGTAAGNAGLLELLATPDPQNPQARIAINTSDLTTTTTGIGAAGTVTVAGPTLVIRNSRLTSSTSSPAPRAGAAGAVRLTQPRNIAADSSTGLRIDDGSVVSVETTGRGAGGSVAIDSANLVIGGGSSIVSSASHQGTAGSIKISVGGSATVKGASKLQAVSRISSAGEIKVNQSADFVLRGSELNATSFNSGGNIFIHADNAIRVIDGRLVARAQSDGNIKLAAAELILIDHGEINAQAAAKGGTISLDPRFVVLNASTINGTAGGQDVTVKVVANEFISSSDSQILSDNQELAIDTDVASALAPIQQSLLFKSLRVSDQCVDAAIRKQSSFSVSGREGLPLLTPYGPQQPGR